MLYSTSVVDYSLLCVSMYIHNLGLILIVHCTPPECMVVARVGPQAQSVPSEVLAMAAMIAQMLSLAPRGQ
jgi:hypothetical protein